MNNSNRTPERTTRDAQGSALSWGPDLEATQAEIVRLRRQIASLQSELAVSVSDRVTSHVALTQTLIEERARLAAITQDAQERARQENLLVQQRAALQRDRQLIASESIRLAVARRQAENAHTAASEALSEDRVIQSGLAQFLSRFRTLSETNVGTSKLLRRAALLVSWTLNGEIGYQLRARRLNKAKTGEAAPSRLSDTPLSHAESPGGLPPVAQHSRRRSSTSRKNIAPALPSIAQETYPSLVESGAHDGPLVSIVVTSFNYGVSVARAVDSVLDQTFKDLEVIVVEGGSPDPDSRLVVARLERPRTRILMQGGPHSAGANRNFGIGQARGRYVCCLDADDTVAPTYIEKAVFLLERQRYDVVGSAMQMVGHDHGVMPVAAKPDLGMLLNGNHVLTSAVFRKSYWERSGGYRDVDRTIAGHVHEDWAFWIRLAALGARFYNLHHDPMLRYTVHRASLSRSVDVAPMWRQRQLVREMNGDLLQSLDEVVAMSRRRSSQGPGTPATPPAALIIDREPRIQRPTVLLALPYMVLGGAERLLRSIVGHLVAIGWRVVIVTSNEVPVDSGDTTHWFEAHTQEIFKLAEGMPPETWTAFLHHLVRSRGVDCLWIVGSALAYDSLRSLRAGHPGLRVADLLFNTVGHTANNRRAKDLIDVHLVENGDVRNWLLTRGETDDRIRLVASGVDIAALAPRPRSDALVAQIEARPHDLIIGFSGRWSVEKNPLAFVEIARLVDPALSLRFVMTGTGPLRSAIEAAIADARFAQGRFHLLGEVDDIADVLGSLDLLVVPSTLDGRPMVVLEALALGVPVLASRVGALPDMIVDGQTGWLCDTGDDAAFSRCIEAAAANPVRLGKMRIAARAYSETHANLHPMLASYVDGLRALLPEARRDV